MISANFEFDWSAGLLSLSDHIKKLVLVFLRYSPVRVGVIRQKIRVFEYDFEQLFVIDPCSWVGICEPQN